jgi:hypothetical protein
MRNPVIWPQGVQPLNRAKSGLSTDAAARVEQEEAFMTVDAGMESRDLSHKECQGNRCLCFCDRRRKIQNEDYGDAHHEFHQFAPPQGMIRTLFSQFER